MSVAGRPPACLGDGLKVSALPDYGIARIFEHGLKLEVIIIARIFERDTLNMAQVKVELFSIGLIRLERFVTCRDSPGRSV